VVTSRLFQLDFGRTPMHAPGAFTWPVGLDEVLRAAAASDVGLSGMTCACLASALVTSRARRGTGPLGAPKAGRTLSRIRVRLAAAAFFAMGVVGIAMLGRRFAGPAFTDTGGWDTSGYLRATLTWPTWAVCLLHYVEGFPVWLTCSTTFVFLVVALNDSSRFSVILGLLFLMYTHISLARARRVPVWFVPAGAALWLLWFPMKYVVQDVNEGKSAGEILATVNGYFSKELGTEEGGLDTQFLDMTAATMTLADLHGDLLWGSTIVPIFVGPVPRAIWPEKPRINEYLWEISIPSRGMGWSQMTAGLVGEAYVDFRYPGVFIICFLVAYLYARLYARIINMPRLTAQRLLYTFVLVGLFQVYRDGLSSAALFPLVHAAPISLTALSFWLWPAARPPRHGAGPYAEQLERKTVTPTSLTRHASDEIAVSAGRPRADRDPK